jgi:chaperonin GroEL
MKASIVVGKILDQKSDTYGYNAQTGEYGDMIARRHGHRRPDHQGGSHRAAGCSFDRGLLITTEAMRCKELPKKEPADGGVGGGCLTWAAWAECLN